MEPAQPVQVKVKAKNWIWVLLLVVIMGAGGATWWWQFSKTQTVQTELAAQKAAVVTAQIEINDLKSEINSLKEDPGTVKAKDSDLILAASDAYVRAPVAAASSKFTYAIKNNTGTFAKVTVGISEGGGYELTLKKVDKNWTVLFAGQDLPGKDVADKYGLPEGYYQK